MPTKKIAKFRLCCPVELVLVFECTIADEYRGQKDRVSRPTYRESNIKCLGTADSHVTPMVAITKIRPTKVDAAPEEVEEPDT